MRKFLFLALMTSTAASCDPITSSQTSDPVATPVYCGDGKSRGSESCDGDDLENKTCEDLGLSPGQLACKPDCRAYDVTDCGAPQTCGNGLVDGVERCEGSDLNGQTCESQGYGPGVLTCLSNCADFDISACSAPLGCGDGQKNGSELCDGLDFGSTTCARLGLGVGELSCGAKCDAIDSSGCVEPVRDAGSPDRRDAARTQDAAVGQDNTVVRDAGRDAGVSDRRDAAIAADTSVAHDTWTPPPTDAAVGQDLSTVAATLRINEVLINAVGTDSAAGNNLFIELWGQANLPLNGYTLVAINGGSGTSYAQMALDGLHTGANGYFLIAHPAGDSSVTAQADLLDSTVDLQNGPDSLQLVRGNQLIDALGYGSFGINDIFAGEGHSVATPSPGLSLSRDSNHSDTDDNRSDFTSSASPSPTGGGGAPTCTHRCSPLTATQCQGDLVQVCEVQSSGCRDWSAAQNCPGAGQTCQGTQCRAPSCTTAAECLPGEGCPAGSCEWIGASLCFANEDCGLDWTCSASGTCMDTACLVPADCYQGQTCDAGICVDVAPGTSCSNDNQCGYYQLCENSGCESVSCSYSNCPVGARCVNRWCERVPENSACLSWSDCGYSQLCVGGRCSTQAITTDCSNYMCNQTCTPHNIGSERYVCANGHCIDMDNEVCQQDADCSRWEYCGLPYPRNGETSTCSDNFNYGRPFNFTCPYCSHGYECHAYSLTCSGNGLMYKKCEWVELGSPCRTNESACGNGRICLSTAGGLDGTCEEWDGVSCPNGNSDCPHSYSCVAGSCVSRISIPCDYNYQCGNGDCCLRSTSTHNFCADAIQNERGCVP